MKIAVVMATYNKEDLLPNSLYALDRQETKHDVTVFIVDDCSEKDPSPIISRYLKRFPVVYKRLNERAGVQFSHGICLEMVPDDFDIVLQPSCDVICLMPNVLNDLCEAVEDKMPAFAGVMDMPISPNFHCRFDLYAQNIVKNWKRIPRTIDVEMNGRTYHNCSAVYSGEPQCSWLFFMGAMTLKNFYDIGFNYLACDAYMHPTMREMGFRAKLLPWLKCAHQRHRKEMYKCNILEHCPHWCIQKDWAKE